MDLIHTTYLINYCTEWMPIIDIDCMKVICTLYIELIKHHAYGLYYTHIYIWRDCKPNSRLANDYRAWFIHRIFKVNIMKDGTHVWPTGLDSFSQKCKAVEFYNHKFVDKCTKFKRLYEKDTIKY